MKNILAYYYGLFPSQLSQNNKKYVFYMGAYKYVFLPSTRSLEELRELYFLCLELVKKDSFYYSILLNKDNQIVTHVDGISYVLLYTNTIQRNRVSINNLINSYIIEREKIRDFPSIIRNDWVELWKQKVDYFEYQIAHFQTKNFLLVSSISYFVGMAENAISYIQNSCMDFYEKSFLTVAHRRISILDDINEFYNPLNLVIDYRMRDVAEYLKSWFWSGFYKLSDVDKFLSELKLDKFDCCLLFGRLLFPSFYFDLYDEIVNGYQNELQILQITNRVPEYERFLYDIYQILNCYCSIPSIHWLEKKFKS